jgi:opacity protein-like surface antigen
MKARIISKNRVRILCSAMLAALVLSAPAAAQSAQPAWEPGKWQFAATVYGWVPTIDGKVNYPGDSGSSDLHVNAANVFSHLKMFFEGALDAHYGRWGIFNDIVYVDLGGNKSQSHDFSVGGIGLPATATTDLNLDIKSLIFTVAGEYQVATDPAWTVDVLGGARMLGMKPTLGYSITGDLGPVAVPGGRNGSKQLNEHLWDGIVGVKGRYAFGDDRKLFLPFYLDVGTGQTQLTWQAAAGVGYAFSWGEVVAVYRYLDYKNKSGKPIEDMTMKNPQLGVTLRF